MTTTLPKLVSDNIACFTGRSWLLPQLLNWWDQGDERLFLLTGGPGTGKSMILAWLSGFGPEPHDAVAAERLTRVRTAVKATHFCQAASRNITPQAFAENIANQLTRSVKGFADALAQTLADRVHIVGTAQAGTATRSTLTGVSIRRIDLATLGDELSFDRSFTQPLQKLYENGHNEPMLLLIDALDEAQNYTGVTIPYLLSRLSDLPDPIRFLVTSRDEPRVLKLFRHIRPFDLIRDASPDVDDVQVYAEQRLMSAAVGEPASTDFAGRVARQAGGIFLYAAMVLDELLARPLAELPDLDAYPLPDGLSGLYHDFLNRELGKEERLWFDLYEPLLGLIAVAQGDGLTARQLTDITGKDIRAALRTIKQYLSGELPEGPFRSFHKSFVDFLLEGEENLDFHIDAKTMDQRIADHYWAYKIDWSKCDEYGLSYLARHLNEAGSDERLFDLVGDPLWMAEKQARLRDPLPLLDDLSLAMRVARDRQPPAIHVLVRSSAASSQLIGAAPPLVVDALARAGRLRRAQSLAENTAFPLDRCRALSWMAQRWHEHGEKALALDCLDDAVNAAEQVTKSFQAMAMSFCVETACAVKEVARAEQLAHEVLRSARERLPGIELGGGRMREREHLLFWTACAARAALGARGVDEVRALVPENRWGPYNLDLQIAAMIGDGALLSEILREREGTDLHPSVPGNLALALAEVGLTSAARTLIDLDAGADFADNTKRMAWAAAMCGDWDRAFALAGEIRHPEEAVRALHRIQQTANAQKMRSGVKRAADLAEKILRELPLDATSVGQDPDRGGKVTPRRKPTKKAASREESWDPSERWRVEVWVAHTLAVAGDFDRAIELAEEICRRNVPSIERNSLCYPTWYSSKRRGHVQPQDPIDVEAFSRELLEVRDRSGLSAIAQICDRLEEQTGRHTWREMGKALVAIEASDAIHARAGWLDALVAAARLGRAEVGAVVGIHPLVFWGDWRRMTEAELLEALEEGDRSVTASHQ